MGTKLQHSLNPLAILLKNNHAPFAIGSNIADTWLSFSNRQLEIGILSSLDCLLMSMDKPLEELNREYVKKTILKHEEIFKQQVWELHRLYRIQKILMSELRNMETNIHSVTDTPPAMTTDTRTRLRNSTSTSEASNCSYVSNKHHSTAPSSEDHLRMNIVFDHEPPSRENGAIFWDHSKERKIMGDPNMWSHGECEVELTLSIGCGTSNSKSKNKPHSDDELECSKSASLETEHLISTTTIQSNRDGGEASTSSGRGKVQGPHWLIQALSLKKT